MALMELIKLTWLKIIKIPIQGKYSLCSYWNEFSRDEKIIGMVINAKNQITPKIGKHVFSFIFSINIRARRNKRVKTPGIIEIVSSVGKA